MTRAKRKIGECVYCGKQKPLTLDHIPPKNLFPKERRENLISVPSCDDCHGQNKQVSKDDEYFRTVLIQRNDVPDSPAIREIRDTTLRSLEKPFKSGFRNAFLKTTKYIELFTKGGIYLGKGVSYQVDLDRLNRVAERIIRGLFFHHKHYRLPNNYKVSALETTGIRLSSKEEALSIADTIKRTIAGRRANIIDKEIFSYFFIFAEDEPNVSEWLLLFFRKIIFWGVTLPRNF